MTGLGNIDDVYSHYLKVIEENQQLRALLRECLIYIPYSYPQFQTEKRIDLDSVKLNLITRINATIGDNEIQANQIADIKIQESEER